MRRPYFFLACICLLTLISACEMSPQPTPSVTAAPTVDTTQATPSVSLTLVATSAPTPLVRATATSPASQATPRVLPTQGALLDVIETPTDAGSAPAKTLVLPQKPRVNVTPTPPPIPTPLPSPPYVQRLFVTPGNPAQLFALMSNNRLVRSDDGGVSWVELSVASTGVRTLTGIGIDYRNPRTLYLTSEKGIFRSDDQGQTWTLVNSLVGQGITVDFADPKILWTARSEGRNLEIRRSLDGGATWGIASSGFFGYVLAGPILIDPQDSNALYAVADGLRGGQTLYRGTRDGVWQMLPYPGVSGYCCFVGVGLAWSTYSRRLIVGSWDGKLYASTNAKEPDVTKVAWQTVADFGPQQIVSALAHGEPNETLYITVFDTRTNQSKLMKSNAGATEWQMLTTP